MVSGDPRLHRLADVPSGMVPDEHEGPFALGRNVRGQPREKGAGDHADGTSPHTAPQPVVGGRHRETITGHRFGLWVLGRYRLFHQADGRVVAPGMHVRRGFTAPPHVIFAAEYKVRMMRSHLDQAVPAFFFRS
jgi:hypothetical protein